MDYGTRAYYEGRLASMRTERENFLSHWRDIADHLMPRLSRFLITDSNKGQKKNSKIHDNTGSLALRTLSSGMMAGLTSPARPWFMLATADPDLNDYQPVKVWLDLVRNRLQKMFGGCNLYTALPLVYGDLGAMGTSAIAVLEDYEDLIRCYHFPIGSYCLATGERGNVDVCYREFQMTVRQLVQKFGYSRCSQTVKSLYDQKSGAGQESWVQVVHAVEPNPKHEPRRQQFSQFKKFHSCYYEQGASGDMKLRESGFDRFRILAPRWQVTGEDTYGSSPGMEVLGDVRGLQLQTRRKQELVDKGVKPPMGAPSQLKDGRASTLPGDVTFYDQGQQGQKFEPLYDVSRFGYQWLLEDIRDHRERIRRGLFEDLFLMLANDQRSNVTAREIAERHEEKLLALGPVVERENHELLDPLIDIAFEDMLRVGALPEPPKELQGMVLDVEYISVLSQAMKLVGVAGVERGVGFVLNVAAAKPEALDMINTYEVVNGYWDMVGASPKMLNDKQTFDEIQERKMEASQQQQMAAAVPVAADTAKTLSEIPADEDTGLSRMIQAYQGVA